MAGSCAGAERKVKQEVSRQGITSNLQATSCSAGSDHGWMEVTEGDRFIRSGS